MSTDVLQEKKKKALLAPDLAPGSQKSWEMPRLVETDISISVVSVTSVLIIT